MDQNIRNWLLNEMGKKQEEDAQPLPAGMVSPNPDPISKIGPPAITPAGYVPPPMNLTSDDNSPFISNRGRSALSVALSGLGDVLSAAGGQRTDYAAQNMAQQRQSAMDKSALERQNQEMAMKQAQEARQQAEAQRQEADFGRKQGMQSQSDDPNSDFSELHRSVAIQIGMDPQAVAGKSATQLQTVAPLVEKYMQAKQMADFRKDVFKVNLGEKEDQFKTKQLQALGNALDPSKQRQGAFGVSKQKFDRAEALETLGNAFSDGNLDSRQIEELAIGLNALLSGSNTGAQRQVEALVPKSLWGNTQKLAEFLTNEPRGTQQRAFVKRLMGTIEREKATAADQIKRTQFSRIAPYEHLEGQDPEGFASTLQSQGIDPEEYKAWKKGGFKPISAVQMPEDGGGPQPGSIEDGYRFKGGDPKDPKNWEPAQ